MPMPMLAMTSHSGPLDQPRDQPGKCLYYARAFWSYLRSHCRLRKGSLLCVLCAYNAYLTPNNGLGVTSVAKKKPGHDAHGNGHGHAWAYARLGHIKRAMHGPD
jgi:hypothetical protein